MGANTYPASLELTQKAVRNDPSNINDIIWTGPDSDGWYRASNLPSAWNASVQFKALGSDTFTFRGGQSGTLDSSPDSNTTRHSIISNSYTFTGTQGADKLWNGNQQGSYSESHTDDLIDENNQHHLSSGSSSGGYFMKVINENMIDGTGTFESDINDTYTDNQNVTTQHTSHSQYQISLNSNTYTLTGTYTFDGKTDIWTTTW